MTLEDFFTLSEIKDGLTSLPRIEELINVMKKEKDCVVNTGDAIRQWTAVANTIVNTESHDCLDLFVKLGGLQFIDKWLKDAGDLVGNAEDSHVEESLTAFLLALEKLCIDKKGVVPPGIHDTLNKLFAHPSLKVQNRTKEVCNELKLSDRDTICDNFVNTELVNDGSQGSSDLEASVQVEKQNVDSSAEKLLSETPNGLGIEKLQNETGVEGESSDLPSSSLDEKDIQKCQLEEVSAGDTGKDAAVMMVDQRHSCHEKLGVTEVSSAIYADVQEGVPSSVSESMKENREVLSSMEKVEEKNLDSTECLIMESASPEIKSLVAKKDISTEHDNQTEGGICGFDLNEDIGSDDMDCRGDKNVWSEVQQLRHVSLDFDLNKVEVEEAKDSSNPGKLVKFDVDLNHAGEETDDDVVCLGSRMNNHRLSSSQLHHFQMNFSEPKSDPFISIMGTKVAVQNEVSPFAYGSACPSMNTHGGSIPFTAVNPRSDRVITGHSPFLLPSSFSMPSSAGPSQPWSELKLGYAGNSSGHRDPPVSLRQFLPSSSEERPGSCLQPLSGSMAGTKRKEPDGGLVLYP